MADDGDMIRSDVGLRTEGESAPVRVTAQDFKRAVDDTASEGKERRKEMEGQKTNSRRRCGSSLGTALGRCHCPLRSWHMSSIFRFRVLGYSATLEKLG
jgi:hypothetical protein